MILGCGGDEVTVRSDDLGAGDRVRREAVSPAQPAEAAAKGVADDSDSGAGSGQTGEPVRRGGPDHLVPHRSRGCPGDAGFRADLDPAHGRGVDQETAVARPPGAVAGRQHANPQPSGRGYSDGMADVVCIQGPHHHGGPVFGIEVPGCPGRVVAIVAGRQDRAVDSGPQVIEQPGCDLAGRRKCHGCPP